MLSVTFLIGLLSDIMLSVIVASVTAPPKIVEKVTKNSSIVLNQSQGMWMGTLEQKKLNCVWIARMLSIMLFWVSTRQVQFCWMLLHLYCQTFRAEFYIFCCSILNIPSLEFYFTELKMGQPRYFIVNPNVINTTTMLIKSFLIALINATAHICFFIVVSKVISVVSNVIISNITWIKC
jgi:hypothetical protein